MKLLVTGACGVTSRAVVRSLRLSARFAAWSFVGTDILENVFAVHEGLYQRIYRVPRVSEPGYAQAMAQVCHRERPDAAIIVPEMEVAFWSSRGFPAAVRLPPPGFCGACASKAGTYSALAGTGLVPEFRMVSRETLVGGAEAGPFPAWMRDASEGSTSARAAMAVRSAEEAKAWALINPATPMFMLSGYLPGRNFACQLLYDRGALRRVGMYERLEYFMRGSAPSGITGNISRGRLMHDSDAERTAITAVEHIAGLHREQLDGIFTVDLRAGASGAPQVTEINLRPVACTYAFAAAGFNMSEDHLVLTLGDALAQAPVRGAYPPGNVILRDIDGAPIWLPAWEQPATGECAEPSLMPGP